MKTVEELKAQAAEERARVNSMVSEVAVFYSEHVSPIRMKAGVPYVSPAARRLIIARLEECGIEDLKRAMSRFKGNSWQVEHNVWRGMEWFFNSYQRIENFLHMKLDSSAGSLRDMVGVTKVEEKVPLSEEGIAKLDEIRSRMNWK